MFNIAIYLDKFKNIESESLIFKKNIILCLESVLKINIDKKNIKINNKIVYLNVNPILKSEIFINKKRIIKDLGLKNITVSGFF